MSRRRRHKVNHDHPGAPVCSSKRRFRDHKQAIDSLRRIAGRTEHQVGKIPTRAYHCQCCKGYHLTSRDDRHAA